LACRCQEEGLQVEMGIVSFSGVERDDEVKGSGNQYNFLFRA